jgi:caspase domain-containing protein/FG-GAP repeat protein
MAPDEPSAGRRRALLIATATYGDPGLAALRAPTGDVAALAAVLGDDAIGGFDVRDLVDLPTEDLRREIETFFAEGRPQDLLLLYVSGHGVLSQSRRFYLATRTTSLQLLRSTAIEDSFINDVMQASRARSIVLVLDCCHSGAFGKGLVPKSTTAVDVEHRFEGQGRVTLSASTELEYAFEEADPSGVSELDPAAPGSLFTRSVVEGLRSGDADVDEDGRVSVDDLYDYVCRRVRERSVHQTPGMSGDVRGEIIVARSPRPARAAPPAPPAQPPAAPPPAAPAPRGPPRRVLPIAAAALAVAAAAVALVVLLPGGGGDDGSGPSQATPYNFTGTGEQSIVVGPVGAAKKAAVVVMPQDGGAAREISALEAKVDVAPGESFGQTIASGDFNGDGNADLVLGTPEHNTVSVMYGADEAGGIDHTVVIHGAASLHRYGWALLARDLDADNYTDLVIGAPGARDQPGVVEIFRGGDADLKTATASLDPPAGVTDDFGSLLTSGDVDGDSVPDLVEGGPDSTGHLVYCLGRENALPGTCTALSAPDNGTSALAIGDLDDDGRDDIIQTDTRDGEGGGVLRIWRGGSPRPEGTPRVFSPDRFFDEHDLTVPAAQFGAAVDAGPIDDDEYADIAVGAPGYNAERGAVILIRGGPKLLAEQHFHQLLDEQSRFGADLALLYVDSRDQLPKLVIVADAAGFDDAVQVRGTDGNLTPVGGLSDLGLGGNTRGMRVGRNGGAD